jgi:dipeptidyl aminopeptidase/acylaminoacyl peptidase
VAVNKVLSRGDVDPKRVGLIGHSLGGYEASYIVSKSNLFAAAVAGAALTDLVSEYLTVSDNYKKAEFWRYEYYTNRMPKPLFDNFEGYLQNSPVYNAPTIQTPLLIWTGEDDAHVAPSQSTELYLAMRRLGKKVTMLRYPNENHNLTKPDAQSDLANKVGEWFDFYLKDGPEMDWMKNSHRRLSN